MIILIVIILLFSGLTILFFSGRGVMLIAGYNTSSLEERAKVNEVNLCKDMGKMMLGITFSLVFYIPGVLYNKDSYFIFGTVLMLIVLIIGMIYMNTGNRYEQH